MANKELTICPNCRVLVICKPSINPFSLFNRSYGFCSNCDYHITESEVASRGIRDDLLWKGLIDV